MLKSFNTKPKTNCFKIDLQSDLMEEMNEEINEPFVNELSSIKSRKTYEKWMTRYEKYSNDRKLSTENVTTFMNWICYLKDSENYMATTVTTAASCVSARLKIKTHQNFMSHLLVKDLIKKINKGHVPKQSAVFTRGNIDCFIANAPESHEFQVVKLVALIGIHCGLRISELCDLQEDDITFLPNGTASVLVKMSKTDPAGRGQTFIITPNPNPKLCCVTRLRNYLKMEKTAIVETRRLFRKISPNGKKTSPVGINKLGKMPQMIASFFKLPDASTYSGHSFRRTSATLLSEQGMNLVELKQHGRWRSSAVAERYCENTTTQKTKVSNMIQNLTTGSSSSLAHEFKDCAFNNCTINILKNN